MSEFYEIRDDLALAEYSNPDVTFATVAPALAVYQEAGTMFYEPFTADSGISANTSRAALGDVTVNAIGGAYTSYACTEKLVRNEISEYDVKQSYTDVINAEYALARLGKRGVADVLEAQVAGALLASPEDISSSSNVPGDVEDMAAILADKAQGEVALVLSSSLFTALKADSNIKDRMKNIGVLAGEGGDPRRITAEQLAAVMGVDRVILAPNRVWCNGVLTGDKVGALVVLPNKELRPREECQWGRVISYNYNDGNDLLPFQIRTWYDNYKLGHVVDTVTKAAFVQFNSALKQAVRFVAAGESSSSSAG